MTEQVAAVQRMQDFIAAHLDEEITLADLARRCFRRGILTGSSKA